MASDLRNILQRVERKCEILVEKYREVMSAKEAVEEENERQKAEILKLTVENQRLRQENEYLRVVRNLATTPEAIEQAKARISKMVRDIDKCISQLTD
ncbi:MAG: hypothetical protein ACI308_07050 [Muribaculaceae bacterium]